jgi:hypothetical protein
MNLLVEPIHSINLNFYKLANECIDKNTIFNWYSYIKDSKQEKELKRDLIVLYLISINNYDISDHLHKYYNDQERVESEHYKGKFYIKQKENITNINTFDIYCNNLLEYFKFVVFNLLFSNLAGYK